MKKTVMVAFCLLGILSALHAQFSFGPEAGINFSTLRIKGGYLSTDQTSGSGFKGGGLVDCSLGANSSFHFQPGVFFSSEGTVFTKGVKLVANYLQIPANLAIKFCNGENDQFFVGAGPYGGFVVGGNVSGNGSSRKIITGSNSNTSDIEPSDFGLGFQAGYQFGYGFFLRAQYQVSVSNVLPNDDQNYSNNQVTGKNSVLGFTVGWLFTPRRRDSYHRPAYGGRRY